MERIRKRVMLLAASTAVVLTPILMDTGNAKHVAGALFSGKVDCAAGPEPVLIWQGMLRN